MVIDPTKKKDFYENWIKKGRQLNISDVNRSLIIKYLQDMEDGFNVSNTHKKGKRSYNRLASIKSRMYVISKHFEDYYNINDIKKLSDRDVISLFNDLRSGKIKSRLNKPYRDIDSYAEVFKTFWHWYIRTNRKNNIEIEDITIDLDRNGNSKPLWVYLNQKQFDLFTSDMKFEYKVMCWFIYDSGIRAPKELMNIKVSDLKFDDNNNIYHLDIKDEITKTFGRKIKLMLCSKLLKDYIERKKLKNSDYIFTGTPSKMNQYLKRVAFRIFGEEISEAGEYYKNITLYDIRHCSSCYWLPRYKSESALKYRFGWKKSDKIHYYSEFLGMKDTISQEDLLIDITATELEKKLLEEKKRSQIMEDRMKAQEDQMNELRNMIIESKVNKIKKSKKK